MPMSSAAISVVILNWNGKQDTLACLTSLQECTYPHLDIIVVDNGSTDGSAHAILTQFPSLHLIENPINSGFAEGNNIGIRCALERGATHILLLNNDTLVASNLFEAFLAGFAQHPTAGILGAKICLYDKKDTLDHLGGMWNSQTATFDFVGLRAKEEEPQWQEPLELDYVCGAAMMFRKEVFQTAGLFDPRFFLIWEESDLCLRAKKHGFSILTCPEAKIWHKVSASFVGGKPHSTYFWWRNRMLWIERNCSPQEKRGLYLRILLPELAHMLKIRLLKKLQLFLLTPFSSPEKLLEKKKKLLSNRAALCGVRDYFLRRFGNGPSWIYRS